ncbi:MAG: hypothetical protein WC749_08810 [Dehalococcoidia bacterium]
MTENDKKISQDEIEQRKKVIKNTLRCPYCNEPLKKWLVPQTPFTQWANEFMYICFNDECPYVIQNRDHMAKMGNCGTYRMMYDQEQDCCQPIPVMSLNSLKEGIVED